MRRPPPTRCPAMPMAVVLVAALVAFASDPDPPAAARGQGMSPPTVLSTPDEGGSRTLSAHVPSGIGRSGATTSPEAVVVPAVPEGVPQSIIGAAESVIGPDGRDRLDVAATSVYPLSAIGQIEFVQDGAGTFICTGYLIDGNSVLTAGHCTFDGGEDDPVDSAVFFPGRNRSGGAPFNPFGSCAVVGVWAPDQWRLDAKPAHDYSVQQLAEGCDLAETAGSFGLFTLGGDNAFAGRRLRVEGYPGDKGYGSRWRMVGEVDRNSVNTLHYPMDTFGGQSGSPLFKWNRPECGGPCSAGVHAYGAGGSPPTNSGPMMTTGRIGTIAAVAAQNGG